MKVDILLYINDLLVGHSIPEMTLTGSIKYFVDAYQSYDLMGELWEACYNENLAQLSNAFLRRKRPEPKKRKPCKIKDAKYFIKKVFQHIGISISMKDARRSDIDWNIQLHSLQETFAILTSDQFIDQEHWSSFKYLGPDIRNYIESSSLTDFKQQFCDVYLDPKDVGDTCDDMSFSQETFIGHT